MYSGYAEGWALYAEQLMHELGYLEKPEYVLGMLAALTFVVGLFDFIELLRRAATKPDATLTIVAEIGGLRLPWIAMQILPFAVLPPDGPMARMDLLPLEEP